MCVIISCFLGACGNKAVENDVLEIVEETNKAFQNFNENINSEFLGDTENSEEGIFYINDNKEYAILYETVDQILNDSCKY